MGNSSRERAISGRPGLVPFETIERCIVVIRGRKVMLDKDLAALYGIGAKTLNQAIKRNAARFPDDFMLQLSAEETKAMRSRFVTASRRNVRYLPYTFTEYGAIMAATILNSPRERIKDFRM